jgi:predicted RNase H-like nuclease (RuvC/YqgF family)
MMSQVKDQELPGFSELEKRVKSLHASEQALQAEVKKLQQKLAETEAELHRARGGVQSERRFRQRIRERLDALLARLAELPALKEET